MIWTRKPFWDRVDIWCAVPVAVSVFLTGISDFPWKFWSLAAALFSVLISVVAKDRSRHLGRREQDERGRLEQADRDERNAELGSVRDQYARSTKDMMAAVLGEFHKKYFRRESKESIHEHRITLFRCVEVEPGGGKHLCIFARHGVHPDSSCTWPVDENSKEGCRGIAAQIWFHGVGTVKAADCPWPGDDGCPIQKVRYAESLGISVDEAERLNVKSTAFTGSRIMARGEKWGVLLLDSRKEGHIVDNKYEKSVISEYADLITSILDRSQL